MVQEMAPYDGSIENAPDSVRNLLGSTAIGRRGLELLTNPEMGTDEDIYENGSNRFACPSNCYGTMWYLLGLTDKPYYGFVGQNAILLQALVNEEILVPGIEAGAMVAWRDPSLNMEGYAPITHVATVVGEADQDWWFVDQIGCGTEFGVVPLSKERVIARNNLYSIQTYIWTKPPSGIQEYVETVAIASKTENHFGVPRKTRQLLLPSRT